MDAILIPMTDLSALRSAGVFYPHTQQSWRWLYRCRAERGLNDAFVRVGRRILVDVSMYLALARVSSEARGHEGR